MKLFFNICLLTMTLPSLGQVEEEKYVDSTIRLQIACGWAGITSEEIKLINKLVKTKDTSQLIRYISSKNIKLQLLSVIALENFIKKKKIQVSDSQLQFINNFKKRKEPIFACYTCTGSYSARIYHLFQKPKIPFRKTLDFHLEKVKY